jgi:hypothetical protein
MKRLASYALFLLLTLYTVKAGVIPAWRTLNSDFPNYYLSSQMLLEGKEITHLYDDLWFNQKLQTTGLAEQGKFSPFPLATAFVMLPLASFPPLTAKRIWTVINLIALCASIWLLQRITGWRWIWAALLILLTGHALINNFRLGQLYMVVASLVLLSHYLASQGRSDVAGVLLGICAIIKYFPLVFIMGYGLAGNRKLVGYSILAMTGLNLVEISVFGLDLFRTYLVQVLLPHLHGSLSMQTPYATAFQSWESLLRNLFVFHPVENPAPVFDWPAGKWLMQGIVYATVFSTAIYLLWKAKNLLPAQRKLVYLSIPAMACLAVLPASATYHFLLLTFPFALFLLLIQAWHSPKWLVAFLVLIYASIGFAPFGFLQKMGLQGLGILLLYPRLWLVSLLYGVCVWIVFQKLPKNQTVYA